MQYRAIVNNMAFKSGAAALLALALCVPAQAKLYKWVDAEGNVHYTDTLPPESAGRGNVQINQKGGEVKGAESAEERKARLAREAEAAAQKKMAAEQARKDSVLLATYTTPAEIDLARDRALEHYVLVIKSNETMLKPNQKILEGLLKQVQSAKNAGKPVDPGLQSQVDAKMAEAQRYMDTIKANQASIEDVKARYQAEKDRFMELKHLTPPAAAGK